MLQPSEIWKLFKSVRSTKTLDPKLVEAISLLSDDTPITERECKEFGFEYDKDEDCWERKPVTVWIDDMILYKHIAFRDAKLKHLVMLMLLASINE
jgi:hypothetical protein